MRSKVRSSLTAPLKYAYRRVRKPELSVIIPAYNAEATIERAIRSVLSQGVQAVEVIVVDDMSTDGTRATVARMAAKDPRIKLLSSGSNGGPGRARNIGVAKARGEYLTFVDADDRVLPHAYERMLETLKETGSDFISGGYRREGASGGHRPEVTQRVHSKTVLRTDLEQFAGVLEEPVLWNKVYRSGFWNRKAGPIPEDRNYEDQEPAHRAALEAESFDVVDYDVYAWNLPERKSTRSQSKRTIADLESRADVIDELLSLGRRMPAQARILLHTTLLGRDLGMYLEQVPYTEEDYWQTLHELTRKVWRAADEVSLSLIPLPARLLSYLGAHGTRDDVETLVAAFDEYGRSVRWTKHHNVWLGSVPYLEEISTQVPSSLLVRGPSEWSLKAASWSAHWSEAGELEVSGYAYIPGVGCSEWDERTIELTSSDGRVLWSHILPSSYNDWVDVEANDPWTTYNSSAFETVVPMPDGESGELRLQVSISISGESVVNVLPFPRSERNPLPWCHQDEHFTARGKGTGEMSIVALPDVIQHHDAHIASPCTLESVKLDGNTLVLKGTYLLSDNGRHDGLALRLVRSDFSLALPVRSEANGAWTTTVDLSDPSVPSAGMFLQWAPSPEGDNRTHVHAWADVTPGKACVGAPPTRIVGPARSVAVSRLYGTRTGVTFGPPLTNLERSAYGRQQERDKNSPELEDLVVFDSFAGKSAGDNPLAVMEQMDQGTLDPALKNMLPAGCETWPRYWSIIDGTCDIPADVEPIYIGSAKWFEKISSAKLIVSNNHLPEHVVPRAGQFWLQTWHGTPLKRLLLDAPRSTTSSLYRRDMERQVPRWSLLLAQDDHAVQDLRSSTGYKGDVLVIEQPRNARLFEDGLRAKTRERLGIGPHERVILYAPTWRKSDVGSKSPGSHFLDPVKLSERTNSIVLVRTHHMTSFSFEASEQVMDVSAEPRVEDLMVASDALISDYSSIFFDYALLNKPMFVYALDKSEYGTKERGFYRNPPATCTHLHELGKTFTGRAQKTAWGNETVNAQRLPTRN